MNGKAEQRYRNQSGAAGRSGGDSPLREPESGVGDPAPGTTGTPGVGSQSHLPRSVDVRSSGDAVIGHVVRIEETDEGLVAVIEPAEGYTAGDLLEMARRVEAWLDEPLTGI